MKKAILLALIFGYSALLHSDRSPRFVQSGIDRGVPAFEDHFTGIKWHRHGKTCWAGNVHVGPGQDELGTGCY